jgi:hypothetical protein
MAGRWYDAMTHGYLSSDGWAAEIGFGIGAILQAYYAVDVTPQIAAMTRDVLAASLALGFWVIALRRGRFWTGSAGACVLTVGCYYVLRLVESTTPTPVYPLFPGYALCAGVTFGSAMFLVSPQARSVCRGFIVGCLGGGLVCLLSWCAFLLWPRAGVIGVLDTRVFAAIVGHGTILGLVFSVGLPRRGARCIPPTTTMGT